MSKLKTIQHLPSSAQVQAAAQDLQHLPEAILQELTPLLVDLERTLHAQRQTIDLLNRQATQEINRTQAQALQLIQTQQQTSEQAITTALTRLNEQMSAQQVLHKHTKAAATQTVQVAKQMQQTMHQAPPLTLSRAIALTLLGALLAAVLTTAGIYAFGGRPVLQGAQQTQR